MTKQVLERIQTILADHLGADIFSVVPTTALVADLDADSLDAIELVMALEEEFDIRVTDEAMDEMVMYRGRSMSKLSAIRKRAWETRRATYGNRGHNGNYNRVSADHGGMLALIIRLHVEGTLSEGQVSRATGLDRIEIRRLAEEDGNDEPSSPPVTDWSYEIKYGPEGQDTYAWIYKNDQFVATLHTWHARDIVEAMNSDHSKSPKKKRDAAERERA